LCHFSDSLSYNTPFLLADLSPLLRFELIQFSLLSGYFGVLLLHPALQIRFLFFSGLHLIADKRSAQQSDSGPDAGSGACVSRSATDDRAQAGSRKGSDRSTLFSRRQRL
jgi:hypothetical protein